MLKEVHKQIYEKKRGTTNVGEKVIFYKPQGEKRSSVCVFFAFTWPTVQLIMLHFTL